MKNIFAAFDPDSSMADPPSPDATADKEALETIMNRGLANKGRSDPATVAQQLDLDYQA